MKMFEALGKKEACLEKPYKTGLTAAIITVSRQVASAASLFVENSSSSSTTLP